VAGNGESDRFHVAWRSALFLGLHNVVRSGLSVHPAGNQLSSAANARAVDNRIASFNQSGCLPLLQWHQSSHHHAALGSRRP